MKKHKQIDAMAVARRHQDFKKFSDLARKKILREEAKRLKNNKQRFEHACHVVIKIEPDYIMETLKEYEKKGFELVSAVQKMNWLILFFKRPV